MCANLYDTRVRTFVSSRSDYVLNQSTDAITDYNQSTDDTGPYFTSHFYADEPGNRKSEMILSNWLRKSAARAHDSN